MLIKCPECNHENQLGAIFCRNCGGKLELDHIAPEMKDKKSVSTFKIIRRVVALVLLMIVICLMLGLFLPFGFTSYPNLAIDKEESTSDTFDAIMEKAEGKSKKRRFVLTPQQLSYIYNNKLLEAINEEGGGSYNIQKVIFALDDDDYTIVVIETKLAGALPVRFEIKGDPQPSAGGNFNVEFNIKSSKMGHVPFPAFLRKIIVEKYQPLLEGNAVNSILESLKTVRVESRAYNIELKK